MKKKEVLLAIVAIDQQEMYAYTLSGKSYALELKNLLKPYPLVHYCLVIHPDDYSTFLVKDRQLPEHDIEESLRYLAAEASGFETYDDWLIYFHSMHEGSLQVMHASPTKIRETIQAFNLEKFSSIDCFDHAIANALVFAGFGEKPTVIISHHSGIIRCTLVENLEIRLVQETALFEQTEQSHSEQLTQRLLHYFQPYHHQELLFLTLDNTCIPSNIPEKWEYQALNLDYFGSIIKNQPISSDYLALIGAGLYHATTLT
jgi:hypothetical protein